MRRIFPRKFSVLKDFNWDIFEFCFAIERVKKSDRVRFLKSSELSFSVFPRSTDESWNWRRKGAGDGGRDWGALGKPNWLWKVLKLKRKNSKLKRKVQNWSEKFKIVAKILKIKLTTSWKARSLALQLVVSLIFKIFASVFNFSLQFWIFRFNFEFFASILNFSLQFWIFCFNFEFFASILNFSLQFWIFFGANFEGAFYQKRLKQFRVSLEENDATRKLSRDRFNTFWWNIWKEIFFPTKFTVVPRRKRIEMKIIWRWHIFLVFTRNVIS